MAGGVLADRLWANWTTLRAGLEASTTSELSVRWAIAGEAAGADETLTTEPSRGPIRTLGCTPRPLWLDEPILAAIATGAACVAGDGTTQHERERLLQAASEASAVVAGARLGAAASGWGGVLVVGMPTTQSGFAAATGLTAADAAGAQAATIMASAASAPRIVVSRAAASVLDATALRTLLVHEGVHAATRSAVSAAPLWVVEGLAESVAQACDDGTAAHNAALVRGAPTASGLPSAAELDGAGAPTAYALSALAVDAAIARWGRPAVMTWVADWNREDRPSDADLTTAYLAARGG